LKSKTVFIVVTPLNFFIVVKMKIVIMNPLKLGVGIILVVIGAILMGEKVYSFFLKILTQHKGIQKY